MKTLVHKTAISLFFLVASLQLFAQDKVSQVEFEGSENVILTSTSANPGVSGTLSSSETVRIVCAQGVCNLAIDYKGRTVTAEIGDRVTMAQVFEYDFGVDGDNEIVVINDYKGTAVLYVFAYASGIIQKLFEREIFNNRTIIKDHYIEIYSLGGLDTVWNYYQGMFWVMRPVEF